MPDSIGRAIPKRQAEYLAGRLSAKICLENQGLSYSTIQVGVNREPLWPAKTSGAISHTNGVAASIVGPQLAELTFGIDVETIVKIEDIDAIKNLVVNNQEYALCMSSELSVPEILTLIFSAKESFFKAAFPYVKAFFDFDVLNTISVTHSSIVFELVQSLSPALHKGKVIAVNWKPLPTNHVLTYIELKI